MNKIFCTETKCLLCKCYSKTCQHLSIEHKDRDDITSKINTSDVITIKLIVLTTFTLNKLILSDNKNIGRYGMLANTLKALMKTHKITVTELAQRTGVARTNINQWLTGSAPNIVQVDKVASYFGITVDELVFGRKPKTSVEELFAEALIHTGHYKISITKLTKKDDE